MQEILKIVRGAISKKDTTPILTHFKLYGGRVQGGNGQIVIDAPCPELKEISAVVPAAKFLLAVDACDGDPDLSLTKAGKLRAIKGSFKAYLPTLPIDEYPNLKEDTESANELTNPITLEELKTVREFIGDDASRPWACGAMMKEGYIYATNNTVVARAPCSYGSLEEPICVPAFTIDELLRIGLPIKQVFTTAHNITFLLEKGVWLQSQLYVDKWPDISRFFQGEVPQQTIKDAAKVAESVRRLVPFCANKDFPVVYIDGAVIKTEDGELMAEALGEDLPKCAFRADVLLPVLDNCTAIDLSQWPKPCPWIGDDGLEGMVIGVKA